MNLIQAQSTAVKLLEETLQSYGWRDGWGITAKDVAESSQPFFYNGATDLDACLTRIRIEGLAKILYLIYSVQGADITYSGDFPHFYAVTITLQYYTDDPAVFGTGSTFHNPYSDYVSNVTDAVCRDLWTMEDGGIEAVASGDDSIPYLHRHTIYITKLIA